MREIKFRAFYKNKIRDVVSIDWRNEFCSLAKGFVEIPLKDINLMQYTGLKDVHGKPIYEGDIVNVTWSRDDTEGENYAIAYDPNNDGYSAFDFVDWYEDMNGLSCAYIDGQITVIGNKFENPELLVGIGALVLNYLEAD